MEEKIRELYNEYESNILNYVGTDQMIDVWYFFDMIMQIEKLFSVIINDDEMDGLDTVEKIIALVKERMNE